MRAGSAWRLADGTQMNESSLWTTPPPPLRGTRRGERLWTLRHDYHVYDFELLYHVEYGVEPQSSATASWGQTTAPGRW
jgi:hypothetical protein